MKDPKADEARKVLSERTPPEGEPNPQDYLSTGLTLVNLAAYGRVRGGLLKGKMYRLAGRSSAGKTFLGRTILAEAAKNPAFDGYELIYDDVERGALMDTAKFFGKRLQERLVPPARDKNKDPLYSITISEFYDTVQRKLESGKRVVYILDSLDSLSGDPERENKMTDGKARTNSDRMRKLLDPLSETGSILVIISQVRANMQRFTPGTNPWLIPEDVISGGRAPEFYSTLDIILRKRSAIKTEYKGKKYETGHYISASVVKNRISGINHSVLFPFHPSFGIDDVGSCVDFLVHSNHWQKEGSKIAASNFNLLEKRERLITRIEEERLTDKLQVLVGKVWHEIKEAVTVKRSKRYD